MKKDPKTKKLLRLDLETVRVLQANELEQVAGGIDPGAGNQILDSLSFSWKSCPNCCRNG